MNIAVVDDEPIVQKRLKGALEKEGHAVAAYASGEEFLRDLDRRPSSSSSWTSSSPASTAWKFCAR